ncbi:hypothetical protein QFC20_007163 [Naganishia adeliensis]|uniref:Uncharacterized protein n=1 Tax=Naganishia adeliensis TaxID=92952 RepID=A0ACC2V3T3_9TREE|nr:hypothetical protein QFC20_007163 [Naganishia adeliensis]
MNASTKATQSAYVAPDHMTSPCPPGQTKEQAREEARESYAITKKEYARVKTEAKRHVTPSQPLCPEVEFELATTAAAMILDIVGFTSDSVEQQSTFLKSAHDSLHNANFGSSWPEILNFVQSVLGTVSRTAAEIDKFYTASAAQSSSSSGNKELEEGPDPDTPSTAPASSLPTTDPYSGDFQAQGGT